MPMGEKPKLPSAKVFRQLATANKPSKWLATAPRATKATSARTRQRHRLALATTATAPNTNACRPSCGWVASAARASAAASGNVALSAIRLTTTRTHKARAKISRKCDDSATWEMLSRVTKTGIAKASTAAAMQGTTWRTPAERIKATPATPCISTAKAVHQPK